MLVSKRRRTHGLKLGLKDVDNHFLLKRHIHCHAHGFQVSVVVQTDSGSLLMCLLALNLLQHTTPITNLRNKPTGASTLVQSFLCRPVWGHIHSVYKSMSPKKSKGWFSLRRWKLTLSFPHHFRCYHPIFLAYIGACAWNSPYIVVTHSNWL